MVPHPWACGSTLGIRLEQSFIQIAANGSSEPIPSDAAARSNGRDGRRAEILGCDDSSCSLLNGDAYSPAFAT